MRLIISIFSPILPGCLQYFITPKRLVPNNFRTFLVNQFSFYSSRNNSINDKVRKSPLKSNFRWDYDQWKRSKKFSIFFIRSWFYYLSDDNPSRPVQCLYIWKTGHWKTSKWNVQLSTIIHCAMWKGKGSKNIIPWICETKNDFPNFFILETGCSVQNQDRR